MKWTPEKIQIVKDRYPHEDNEALAKELGCTRKALAFRASVLGVGKTEAANEQRYARMATQLPEHLQQCEKRKIATGLVVIKGNVLLHISNASMRGA